MPGAKEDAELTRRRAKENRGKEAMAHGGKPVPRKAVTTMAEVLVVDDDAATRDIVRLILEDAGYTALETADQPHALEVLQTFPRPLVVLLDLTMISRRADGEAVLRAAQADPHLARHCYVVLTAHSETRFNHALRDLLAATCLEVVAKPFNMDDLLDAVQRAQQHLATRMPQ